MSINLHIAAICGSLRKESYNLHVFNTALQLLPEGVSMELLPIADLPLYNQDFDIPALPERPATVVTFRQKLEKADGILFVSPEYNYSIPGVLKNAIDWASRGKDSPILKKPVALIGATDGAWGTIRMQLAFEPIFLALDMMVVQKPEVLIAGISKKLDTEGNVADETTRTLISQKLMALKQLMMQYKK